MRALVLGGTGRQSLGRAIALSMLGNGITPILVGRNAEQLTDDTELCVAELVTMDLMDPDADKKILAAAGDLVTIQYVVIAGGGPHLKGNVIDHDWGQVRQLWRSVVKAPVELLVAFHRATTHPYHVLTIASTSATAIRQDETIYAMAQAARRAFALNFYAEHAKRLGSKSLIVCPGGMKTGMWVGSAEDTSRFMDPDTVAKIIWQTTQAQRDGLVELTIRREKDGTPNPSMEVHQE